MTSTQSKLTKYTRPLLNILKPETFNETDVFRGFEETLLVFHNVKPASYFRLSEKINEGKLYSLLIEVSKDNSDLRFFKTTDTYIMDDIRPMMFIYNKKQVLKQQEIARKEFELREDLLSEIPKIFFSYTTKTSPTQVNASVIMGIFLGYPTCCIKTFVYNTSQVNINSTLHTYHVWSCSQNCEKTLELNERYSQTLKELIEI